MSATENFQSTRASKVGLCEVDNFALYDFCENRFFIFDHWLFSEKTGGFMATYSRFIWWF
jgi:hypothetical protein